MAQIIQLPPDPTMQSFLDYVSRLQAERYRREQERAQSRTFDPMGFLGGGLVGAFPTRAEKEGGSSLDRFGAGFGKVLPFATAALGGAVAGPAGIGFGAELGGQVGQMLGGGETARGMTTAAKAAGGLMQAMQDKQLYGYSPTAQDKANMGRLALQFGTSLGQIEQGARLSGKRPEEVLRALQVSQADDEQLRDWLVKLGIPLTVAQYREQEKVYPGGPIELGLDLQEQAGVQAAEAAGQKEYATVSARRLAEVDAAARSLKFERTFDPRQTTKRSADLADIDALVESGELSVRQGAEMKASLPRLSAIERPRTRPLNIGETAAEQLGLAPLVLNGQVVDHAITSLDRDTRPRVHGLLSDRKGAEGIDMDAVIKHHENLVRATLNTAIPMSHAADNLVEAKRIVDSINAGTYGQLPPPPPPTGPLAGPPAPGTPQQLPPRAPLDMQLQQDMQAQGQLRAVQNAAAMITKAVAALPDIERWPPELRERVLPAATVLNKMFIDKLRRGAVLTPDEERLARLVKKIILEG